MSKAMWMTEITEHNCWKAIYQPINVAHSPPAGHHKLLPPQVVLDLDQAAGHSTCIDALQALVPQHDQVWKHVLVSRCDQYYRLSSDEFRVLILDSTLVFNERTVFSVAVHKCRCKAKTAVVCNFEPQPAHIITLEESPFGLAPLTAETVQLGLVVYGPLQPCTDLTVEPEEGPRTFFGQPTWKNYLPGHVPLKWAPLE